MERSLSNNSVEAYIDDVNKLERFMTSTYSLSPKNVQLSHLQQFIREINEIGLSATSQSRILSGIRSFYKYLVLENEIADDPSFLLDFPKTMRKLPEVLNIEEINKIDRKMM